MRKTSHTSPNLCLALLLSPHYIQNPSTRHSLRLLHEAQSCPVTSPHHPTKHTSTRYLLHAISNTQHSPTSRLLQSPRDLSLRNHRPNKRSLQKSRPKTPPRSRPLGLPRKTSPHKALPTNQRRILHPLRRDPETRLRLFTLILHRCIGRLERSRRISARGRGTRTGLPELG